MGLLIDGYNLLHVSGVFGSDAGPATFERARVALLNYLTAALDPEEIQQATIVFDAMDAPPGLPGRMNHRGLRVWFARGYENADAMLEDLIRKDTSPRRLTVVSSDHRVKRAARRRRAIAIDSDQWWEELSRRHRRAGQGGASIDKPAAPLSPEQVERWVEEFENLPPLTDEPSASGLVATNDTPQKEEHNDTTDDALEEEPLDNPFPPGYGEDLLEDL